MKTRLIFCLKYFLFWLLLFVLGKILFLLYEHQESFKLTAGDWLGVIVHGFRLDLSAASYIILLPVLLMMAGLIVNPKVLRKIADAYTAVMLVIFLLLTFGDLEIYKYWGIRIDTSPLKYLKTPAEALASSTFLTIASYVVAFIVSLYLLMKVYRSFSRQLDNAPRLTWKQSGAFLFLSGLLVLPIRGGIGVSTMNVGSAYFHTNPFANHAAINVMWNFGHSVAEGQETENRFRYFEGDEYVNLVKDLYDNGDSTVHILNTSRPDVVLVILESFSSKLIETLGGEPGITPEFNKLAGEGVLFSHIYATDSRTDKGLATILSGFPVLESMPILSYPEKNANLPFLSRDLISQGYNVSFSYGGEIDFANMRSYLVNGGITDIMSDESYTSSFKGSKWGLPDNVMFDNFYSEVSNAKRPFFKMLLTISNHEPFEIPGTQKFGNRDLREKYLSSAYFADSCLGSFIAKIKQTPAWDNLLIILVADHGSRLPDYCENFEPEKFTIPVLWLGGAVTKDTVITKYGSQADIAVSLLRQMDLKTDDYFPGKDLFSPSSKSFAFYSFKDGIGMMTDTTSFGIDLVTGKFIFSEGDGDERQVEIARAFHQYVYQRYLDL